MDEVIVKTAPVTRMSFAAFAAFYGKTPPDERWELIDGEAIEMAPASKLHQRIAGNLKDILNVCLRSSQPAWYADHEVGLRDRVMDRYAPQPDVTVSDSDIPDGLVWSERFYFVIEVLSEDRKDVLDKKRHFYETHADCRGYMFVSQTEIAAELTTRSAAGWQTAALGPDDAIIIPDIGNIGDLRAAYVRTRLLSSTPSAES